MPNAKRFKPSKKVNNKVNRKLKSQVRMLKQKNNIQVIRNVAQQNAMPYMALSHKDKMIYKLMCNTIDLSLGTLEEYQQLQAELSKEDSDAE